MVTIKISFSEEGMRLDRFLRKSLNLHSLSEIYKMIRKGLVRINGKKKSENYRLQINDIVVLPVKEAELSLKSSIDKEKMVNIANTDYFKRNLKIIYEDDYIIACNKPPRLVVHSGSGHEDDITLIDLIKSHIFSRDKSKNIDEIVLTHRLDKDTSGIILAAKDIQTARILNKQIRDGIFQKKYFAICHGLPNKLSGTIQTKLLKTVERNSGLKMKIAKEGLFSKTKYTVIEHNEILSKLSIIIFTGRTHQIRVHMAYIGCPVVGDNRYGDYEKDKIIFANKNIKNRLYLHSNMLSFLHPSSQKRFTLTAAEPEEFNIILKDTKNILTK